MALASICIAQVVNRLVFCVLDALRRLSVLCVCSVSSRSRPLCSLRSFALPSRQWASTKKRSKQTYFAHNTRTASTQKTNTKALTHACAYDACSCVTCTQGTILIAVNTLRKVADPDMSEFMNRSLDPESPHPYAIAEVSTYSFIICPTVYPVPGMIYS